MHLDNKLVLTILIGFFLCVLAGNAFASSQNQQNQTQQNQNIQPTPLPPGVNASDPALPVWVRPAVAPGANTSNEENRGGSAGHVIKKGEIPSIIKVVTNVTLPVTVVNQKQHVVTDLKSADFLVYENGAPQEIINFSRDDIAVSIGILVDNSGSMREKRAAVTRAVLNLVKASNKDDEVFIVNFGDESYLDQDFTNDLSLLEDALERLDSRGGTALYDAVIASTDHLARTAKKEKKVLLVITDGEDNESSKSLEQALRAVHAQNGPMIYSIGILGHEGKERRAKRALAALSLETGGVAFFPRNLEQVDAISQAVARDIRNQYSLTYKPTNQTEGFRKVRVEVHAAESGLTARTKSGYFASQQRTSPENK